MVTKCSGQEANSVASFPEDLVSLFEDGYARPLKVSRIERHVTLLRYGLEPIVQAPDHDGTNGAHSGNILPVRLSPLQPSLNGLGYLDALRDGERDGRIDADAVIGQFFDGLHACSSHGDLHNHVRCERIELETLVHDRLRIAINARIR